MKTYLLVNDNECQRCNNRWTSSYVTNTWAAILSPTYPVERISAFFHRKEKHQACFNCIEHEAIGLPLPHAQKHYEPTGPKARSTPETIDILGD